MSLTSSEMRNDISSISPCKDATHLHKKLNQFMDNYISSKLHIEIAGFFLFTMGDTVVSRFFAPGESDLQLFGCMLGYSPEYLTFSWLFLIILIFYLPLKCQNRRHYEDLKITASDLKRHSRLDFKKIYI